MGHGWIFKLAARQLTGIVVDDARVVAPRFVDAVSCLGWRNYPKDGIRKYCPQPAFLDALGDKETDYASKTLVP